MGDTQSAALSMDRGCGYHLGTTEHHPKKYVVIRVHGKIRFKSLKFEKKFNIVL